MPPIRKPKPVGPPNNEFFQADCSCPWETKFKWRYNAKGNIVRSGPRGEILTVFQRASGRYAWSIARGRVVRFSPGDWAEEIEAMRAVWSEATKER